MKVLSVNKLYFPWIGGIETAARQFAEGIADTEILCCVPKGPRIVETIDQVKVWRAASLGIVKSMPLSLDFLRLFHQRSRRADIIALHHPFPLVDLAMWLSRPNVPVVVHYHSDIVRQKLLLRILRPLIRHTLRRAKKIIVSNPNMIESSDFLPEFRDKCTVVPFGVDIEKTQKVSSQSVAEFKDKYGEFVLFVGRPSYYKGLSYLLTAMLSVQSTLVIVGDGPERAELEQQSKNLGIDDRVHFVGRQSNEDLQVFFHACTLFVLPSIAKSEAFGIVLIEAMMAGKPLITTELGTGTSWVNQHQGTGIVVPPKDSQVLAQAIMELLTDNQKYQYYAQQAFERAKQYFTLKASVSAVESVYRSVSQDY